MSEFAGTLFSLIIFGMFYIVLSIVIKNNNNKEQVNTNQQNDQILIQEKKTSDVKKFLNTSQFYQSLAVWQNKTIYKFIFNRGFLYEFSEILPDDENIQEINDQNLFFDRLKYKRVENPEEFIKKFKLN